jgi:hypothetical protein
MNNVQNWEIQSLPYMASSAYELKKGLLPFPAVAGNYATVKNNVEGISAS